MSGRKCLSNIIQFRIGVAVGLALIAVAFAGCSGFGGPKKDAAPIDPNAYPANYRSQIATFLRQSLTSRADFRGALIAAPMLMPIGDSQRYMVCVQFRGNGQVKNKVAIYFGGMISQFIDPRPSSAAPWPIRHSPNLPPRCRRRNRLPRCPNWTTMF